MPAAPSLDDDLGEPGPADGGVETDPSTLGTEPRALSFRVAARAPAHRLPHGAGIPSLADRRENLPIPDPLERVRGFRHPGREERPDLFDEPLVEEPVHARVEASTVRLAIQVDEELEGIEALVLPVPAALSEEPFAPAGTRLEGDLERSDEPLRVGRRDSLGRAGIEAEEEPVEPDRSPAFGDAVEPPPTLPIAWRSDDDPTEESAEVHAGPPHDHRNGSALRDLRDRAVRLSDEDAEVVVVPGIGDVHEVVGNARPILPRRLRRGRVESAVDLKRVAADDLAADRFRDPERDVGFPGPRGTAEDEDRGQALPGRFEGSPPRL